MGGFSELGRKIREEGSERKPSLPLRTVVVPVVVDRVVSEMEETHRRIREAIKDGFDTTAAHLAIDYVALATGDNKLPKDYTKIIKLRIEAERRSMEREPKKDTSELF